jgi:hypothetical protein
VCNLSVLTCNARILYVVLPECSHCLCFSSETMTRLTMGAVIDLLSPTLSSLRKE